MAPTRILTVFRETVKPGKGGAHDAHESAWAAANAAAKYPVPMLAVRAATGASETWYISGYPTWAAYEQSAKAMDANPAFAAIDKQYSPKEDEFLSDGRSMILERREDLSFGAPADLATSRFFTITRIAIRPGHTAEYVETRKMVKAAHESAHMADAQTVWEARGGVPAGTFFTLTAHKSFAELDSAAITHGAAYQAALGGPDGQKKLDASAAAAVISSETNNFSFVPSQSLPPAEWVTAYPGFWKPKAPAKKTP